MEDLRNLKNIWRMKYWQNKTINVRKLGEIELMNRAFNIIQSILNGIIISGMIIFVIGLYYMIIKAGIPYQDPTEELKNQYAINMGIGEELLKDGFFILIAGIIGKIGTFVFRR